jgi:hypothetical protein
VEQREVLEWIREWYQQNFGVDSSQKTIQGVDLWKMKARWLNEKNGMVLMVTHPDYLCHRRLKYTGGEDVRRLQNDVKQVREQGVVSSDWHGSLLEQYAAFLNWFKREFEGEYWHCLANDVARWAREEGVGSRCG